jgi:hypothetical protein
MINIAFSLDTKVIRIIHGKIITEITVEIHTDEEDGVETRKKQLVVSDDLSTPYDEVQRLADSAINSWVEKLQAGG